MADTAAVAVPESSEQNRIEMGNGVVLTGMGGDTEALTEQFEQRIEELHPETPAPETPATAQATEPQAKEPRGKKRFEKLTFEREEAVRRADAAEAKAKDLEARLAAPPQAMPVAPAAVTQTQTAVTSTRQKPTEAEVGTKYPNYADFVEDLSDWKTEQKLLAFQQTLDARTGQRIEADRASRTRADYVTGTVFPAGRTAYQDFDAVLNSVNDIKLPPAYQEALLSLPNPEHVMYALAKDRAKLTSILQITDGVKLGVELAQLMPRESVAPLASTAPVVRTTNAPAPPQPVGAGSRTTSPSLDEAALMGQDAYLRARGRKPVRN